jgi:cytochrome P450
MIATRARTPDRKPLTQSGSVPMPLRATPSHLQAREKTRPMPGPRGYPLIGVLPDLVRHTSPLPLIREAWRTYGDVVRLPMGPYTVCFFAQPDAVKHILVDNRDNYPRAKYQMRWLSRGLGSSLVSSEGERWRRRRHLMHGPFTVKAVRGYATAMASAVQDVLEGWERRLAEGRAEIDLSEELVGLSMDALGRSVLGFDARSTSERAKEAFLTMVAVNQRQAPTPFPPPLWLPLPDNLLFKRSRHQVDEVLYEAIRARRATLDTDDSASDVLSLMLRAKDDDGVPMSDRDVRDEVLSIYIGGHESMTFAMDWAFYAIAQHPEVERRLHEEVDRELGEGLPTAEVVERLTYTDMVVRETLRLYPSFTVMVRDVREDDQIAGYRVPRGAMAVVSPHLTQRHPDFWPDPERFDPERHAPGQVERQHRFSWFPFGAGPHACIGAAFALHQMKIAIAMIPRRYRLSLLRQTHPSDAISPRPVGGLHMRLERRR